MGIYMQLINHPDLDRLYLKTLGQGLKRVAITACDNHSGVSTLAMALAQRHLLAGHSVLYVEMNSLAPAMTALYDLPGSNKHNNISETNTTLSHTIASPMLVAANNTEDVITGVLAPQEQNHILALRNPKTLNKHLESLGQDFDALVIDCAPLGAQHQQIKANQLVPADLIATVADATILLVQAGKTKAPHLKSAINLLQQHNISPSAIVMNNQFNPSLGQELIREAKRLNKILPKLSQWLSLKISQSLLMIPL